MATGGSGDVLTGVVLALLAQGYVTETAARLAAYVHGLAGDIARKKHGAMGMTAGTSSTACRWHGVCWKKNDGSVFLCGESHILVVM